MFCDTQFIENNYCIHGSYKFLDILWAGTFVPTLLTCGHLSTDPEGLFDLDQ